MPRRLDQALGLLKYVYLGLAICFAVQPAIARDFVICRFDPFVGFFRRTGFAHMMLIGAGFLLLGMFVGRPYCRYLCPYGGLLSWCSRLARRGVTITPARTGLRALRRRPARTARSRRCGPCAKMLLLRSVLCLLSPRDARLEPTI